MNVDPEKIPGPGSSLALGFGTAVAMWTAAYVCRFPGVEAPGTLTLAVLLLLLVAGGRLAARLTGDGAKAGAKTGLIASLINLLILGSVIASPEPNRFGPSAPAWIVGSLLLGACLGGIGGASRRARERPPPRNWTGALAIILVAATFLLLVAGGIVTGARAGLAVVDWPNSFGYNMFLYPLAKMSEDIYYEHAHRLLGTLVGLATLVLAIRVFRHDRRPWLKGFAAGALVLVIAQGFLGGMRVTGRPTLSTSPEEMAPSLLLALVHGVVAQLFFGMTVALAVFLSARWIESSAQIAKRSAAADRSLSVPLLLLLVVQIATGAVERHFAGGLHLHIGLAVVVLVFGAVSGARAWGLYADVPALRRTGLLFIALLGVQIVLGFTALVAVNLSPEAGPPSAADIAITTAHQAVGAALLAHAVLLFLWLRRLVAPACT